MAILALTMVGCKDKNEVTGETYPVSGRTYVEAKYNNTELQFAKSGNKVLLIEHSEAGQTVKTNQFFKMNVDTIVTYNNTKYDDQRGKYVYHDTYLTSYYSDQIVLNEKK